MKEFLDDIVEKFGKAVLLEESEDINFIKTGSYALDFAIGGGIPIGRITEIYGPEGSGKTTLSLNIARNAMKKGLNTCYIDVENMLDYGAIESMLGEPIDRRNLVILQPDTAEDSFIMAEKAINSGLFGLVIFDSIGMLAPKKEKYEDEFEDSNYALIARMLSKFIRRNSYSIRKNNVAFIFINQVRDLIGSYVKAYSTPGGHAVKHAASVIITLAKGDDIKQGSDILGINVKFTIKKNKLSSPFRTFYFPIYFGKGIDSERDLMSFGEYVGIIQRSGTMYKFGDVTLGRGMNASCLYLKEHPEILDKIEKALYNVDETKAVASAVVDSVLEESSDD